MKEERAKVDTQRVVIVDCFKPDGQCESVSGDDKGSKINALE